MGQFLTPLENLALSVAFKSLGESRINRTTDEYDEIAARAPKQAALLYDVNRALEDMAIAGYSCEICETWILNNERHYKYINAPASVSPETLRKAWKKSGMRELQLRRKPKTADGAKANK